MQNRLQVPVESMREVGGILLRDRDHLEMRLRYLATLLSSLQEEWRGVAADAFLYECRQGLDAMAMTLELPAALGRRLDLLADRFTSS